MTRLLNAIPYALGIVGLILLYGLVGEPEQERQASTAYVEETMQSAKQDALNREREAQWVNLNRQAESMLALGEIK